MKILHLFLTLILALNTSCDKDDGQTSLEKLPPATQTGAQTFGCLINGEAFVPALFGSRAPRAFYQFVRGAYTFNISGSRGNESGQYSIAIGGIDVDRLSEGTYVLEEEMEGKHYGQLLIGGEWY